MPEIETRAFLPQVSADFAELVHQGTYLPNIFDLADGVYTREFVEKIPNLLRVVVEAKQLEIPPALLALPPDAEVILRYKWGDSVNKAWLAISILESNIQRQAKGFFELSEAAEILSEACTDASGQPIPSEEFFKAMSKAFFSGQLPFFNHSLTLIAFQNEDETSNFGTDGETTSPKAINAWLESTGSPHRFPVTYSASKPATDTSKGTPSKLTESDKAEVVRLYDRSRGVSVNKLAKQFGVSNPTIDKALKKAGVKN